MKLIRKILKEYVCKDIEDVIMSYITEKCFECEKINLSRYFIKINDDFYICSNCINKRLVDDKTEYLYSIRKYKKCMYCHNFYTFDNFYNVRCWCKKCMKKEKNY